ncbi:MAG: PAS domain-containing protein [Rhodobiaceae bacterium]|nr:PAS domain-containing protein [Rhodobiaceae bacterium]
MSAVVVKSDAMIAYASLWYEARDEAGVSIPAKSDLPLRGLAAFMPNLLLHRIDVDGRAFCLLFGTALTDAFGQNLTGTYLEESMAAVDAQKRRETFEAFYREHGEEAPFGRWVSGTLNSRTGDMVEFESLALPYIEPSDGSTRLMVHVRPLAKLSYGDRLIPHFTEETVRMFRPDGPRPDWLRPRSGN